MARRASSQDSGIDQLYQVPLDEFIAARNALAKRAGASAADIRARSKPTLPAWAVNQLYWQKREIYDELVARAHDLRATHHAALRGARADLRSAGRAHDEAVDHALKATLALLAEHGQMVTDMTRQAIATTVRALPAEEDAPGRLSRQLQPRGFEALGAAAPRGRVNVGAPASATPKKKTLISNGKNQEAKGQASRLAAAKNAAATAERATREAEQLARRTEFEAARAARDADKAQRRVDEAEDAVRQAQEALEDARRTAAPTAKARETAQARAAKAAEQLADAREREEAAKSSLDTLT